VTPVLTEFPWKQSHVQRLVFQPAQPGIPPWGRVACEVATTPPCRLVQADSLTDAAGAGAAEAPVLEVLTAANDGISESDALDALQQWVAQGLSAAEAGLQAVALHGVQVVWGSGSLDPEGPRGARIAVAALAERLPRVLPAILEFACLERALQTLERQVAQAWPQLEEDGPLAFDFDHRSERRRGVLAGRFQDVLRIRARWAQLQPPVHRPLVYPPTLASQVGERLRERARLAERWESLGGQIDIFQNVYELCAQRAQDWRLAWKGHTLEVLIILLLLLQTVLLMFELFASRET
jgi:hypothetical protein